VLWEAGALAYLHWTTSRMLDLTAPLELALAATLAVVWVAGAYRIHRIGLYVNDEGLLIRNLLTTKTLLWYEVDSVTVEPVVHRLGAFTIPSGQCVILRRPDGSRVNTSLWEKGVDFHADSALFRAVHQDLRNRHAAALTPAGR
jgi:hypothetical protein